MRALQRLRALLLNAEQAKLLGANAGDAGLQVERIGFLRDGRAVTLPVKLAERPQRDRTSATTDTSGPTGSRGSLLGMSVRPLDANLLDASLFPKPTVEWDDVRVWQPAAHHVVCTTGSC